MKEKTDERFEMWESGRNFNESIYRLKSLWWEKEGKPDLIKSINKAMETADENIDKEVLEIMKELLKATRVKKMEDYLNDG
jgi:hypothetical protein